MDEIKMLEKISKLETQIATMQNEINQLKGLAIDIHEMSTRVVLITEQIKYVTQDLNELKDDVQSIQDKPEDRLELIVKSVLTAVISAIVAYLISQLK